MIAAARAEGLAIDCDAYPYTAGSNPLKNLLPQWVQAGGIEAMLARLAETETRARIRAEIARDGLNNWGRIASWDCVQISISPHLPQHAGDTIAELAAARGADPIDAVCDYLIEDQGATRVLVTSIAEDDIREIVRSPDALWSAPTAIASPITASSAKACRIRASTAPFRASSTITCRRAAAAARSGDPQDDRRDRRGAAAARPRTAAGRLARRHRDLRSGRFQDRATYAEPHQYPTGARTTVLVNGTIVVDDARHTGALPGTVLRRAPDGTVG